MSEVERDAATPDDAGKPESTKVGQPAEAAAPDPAPPGDDASSEAQPEPEPELSPEEQRIRELEGEVAAARSVREEAQARLRTVSKAYSDLQHEMKAFRERMEARSKLDSELQAFQLAKTFFDPVMNLKRSLQSGAEGEALVEGLRMVHHQFMVALEKLGLEEVPGEGAPFDPNVHEALAIAPVTDPAQDNKVLVVHTTGYSVKGKVLQAAQVVIGKLQEEAAGEA